MNSEQESRPPRLARRILSVVLPSGVDGRTILGDLHEEYVGRVASRGVIRAQAWYWSQVVVTGFAYARPGRQTLDQFAHDLRFALRGFIRRPSFTAISVVMMALGIGATTTIFSVVDGVLIKKLPYPDPEGLVYFKKGDHSPVSFKDWQAHSRESFASLAAVQNRGFDLTGEGDPERLKGATVTPDFLPMFAASTVLGRLFVPSDFVGEPRVVILTHGFWTRRFGADPDVVGRTVRLSDASVQIVGVLSPDFLPPEALVYKETEVWLPMDLALAQYQDASNYILSVVGRLRDGLTLPTAQANLDALAQLLAEDRPEVYRRRDGSARPIEIASLMEQTVGGVKQGLMLLLGAVSLMLVIACANVANLFLARGSARGHEFALRAALGASPNRLIRQLLTESVALSTAGGVVGIALAVGGVEAFRALNPGQLPLVGRIQVDVRVLGFALATCLVTGVVFGLVPGWQAWRQDVAKRLQTSSSRSIGGFRRAGLRSTLIVAQIGLSLMLLTGAGLLFTSFLRLRSVDPGFDSDGLAAVPLLLDGEKYSADQRALLGQELVRSLEGVPGVRQVAVSVTYPFEYFSGAHCCWFNSDFRTSAGIEPGDVSAVLSPVSPGYFDVLGARLVGRAFAKGDEDADPVPVVLSDELSRALYPGAEALGESFTIGSSTFTVIGVVRGLHNWGLSAGTFREMYLPWEVGGPGFDDLSLLVRTEGDPTRYVADLRRAVWAVAPELPVPAVLPMRTRLSRSLVTPRFLSAILILFAALGTLLAAGGIYGSVLYHVCQRNGEFGLRLALGAARHQVLFMVVRGGSLLALSGVLLGIGGALMLSRVLGALLFEVRPTDPSILAGAALLVSGVTVAASYMAARRAVVADPATALSRD